MLARALVVALACLISTQTIFSVTRPTKPSTDAQVDAYVKQQMAKYQIPGMAIAVVKNGKLLKEKGYGLASVEFDVPTGTNTVFQMFSVSKVFAGVAVMKLVEDGKLSLDTPITNFFDAANIPAAWKQITVWHLLSHTSGLPELRESTRYACLPEDRKKKLTPDEELGFLAELPMKASPGDKWSYHIAAYHLLGYIIERASKKSYAQFLTDEVFSPVGMNATSFGSTDSAVIKRRSPTSYNRETGELTAWIYPFSVRDYPAAGLNSSVNDLSKFLIALQQQEVVRKETAELLWTRTKLSDGTTRGYGLGWTVGEHKGHKVVGHEGGGAIWLAHFPEKQLSVVVLCNLNGARADEIQYGIADFYL
jgi:D-alanyl-D-alanine carboxypeptidase